MEVTRRPEDFGSAPSILMENLPVQVIEAAQSIIAMDAPRHPPLRRLMASAFTPRQMRTIEDQIKANAALVIDVRKLCHDREVALPQQVMQFISAKLCVSAASALNVAAIMVNAESTETQSSQRRLLQLKTLPEIPT